MLKVKNLPGLALLLLTACEVGPEYEAPKSVLPDLNTKVEISKFMSEKWWSIFHDSTLDQLEEKALKHNADLAQAIENVEMARAEVDVAFSDFFPSLSASGSAAKERISETGNSYIKGFTQSRSNRNYNASASALYEVDLFGKYRNASKAAKATLLASAASKQVVLLSVTSEVARTFFLIRALEAKLIIARRTLKTRQDAFNIYQNRYSSGYCTQLDFLRVKAELYSVKTTVLNLEKGLSSAETAMSVLIGNNPREMVGWKLPTSNPVSLLNLAVAVPEGIPSDILARRPDVVAAEGQLIAANAKIGEAMSAHFPSLSLTGSLGYESKSLTQVFQPHSDILGFGMGINLPIFNAGKIVAMTKVAEASYRKQLAAYTKSVQVAFKETLDALMTYHRENEIVSARTVQVNSLKASYNIAKKQKEVGMIGLIDLLDVERGLLSAEIELVEAQQNKLDAIVDICKAMGGGWTYSSIKKMYK